MMPEKVMTVVWLGIASNVVLTISKLVAGVVGHSAALIADAGHSLSDLASDFATLFVVKLARQPPDAEHPYGHGKIESMGSLAISLALFGTGCSIGWHSLVQLLEIINATGAAHEGPSWLAMSVCVAALVMKEALFHVTMRVAKRERSPALEANAWHHRIDSLSSVIALVGIAGSMAGFPSLDPLGGLVVSGLIVKVGAELSWTSVKELTDTVIDPGESTRLSEIARGVPGVLSVPRLRSRPVGGHVMVDMSIRVPFLSTVSMAHHISEHVRRAIMEASSAYVCMTAL